MPYKDIKDQREYQRQWVRNRRQMYMRAYRERKKALLEGVE